MGDDKPKEGSALEQLNALASNYKGLLILLAIAGGSGAGFDWLEPFSSASDDDSQAARVVTLERQIEVLQTQVGNEREVRELGVNGNTLQINNLRNRIAAIESRLLSQ